MSDRIPADWPPVIRVADVDALATAIAIWEQAGVLGVDTEANSFFAYHERLCLVQVSTADQDWIVDPKALGDDLKAMNPLLADPNLVKIFHAAEFDLMILKKELGAEVRGMFDTQVAMTLLRHDKTGLAALIKSYYGLELSKKEQRSDWGKRPLTDDQIDYARIDTHFLPDLHQRLVKELAEANMTAAAEGEFRRQETEILEPGPPDPNRWQKLKGSRGMSPEQMGRLKDLFEWREQKAESRDVPPFKVLGNAGLIGMAKNPPTNVKQLANIDGVGWKSARRVGDELMEVLKSAEGKTFEVEVTRVSPEERMKRKLRRENLDAMRDWRKAAAKELGLPSERLLHRRQLEAITAALPKDSAALLKVVPLSDWQRENLESSLLEAVEKLPDPEQV